MGKLKEQIGPRMWQQDRRFYDLDGEPIHASRVIFHGRINNDGLTVLPVKDPEGPKGWFRVFCLSCTFNRWIATDAFSTYVVELVFDPA